MSEGVLHASSVAKTTKRKEETDEDILTLPKITNTNRFDAGFATIYIYTERDGSNISQKGRTYKTCFHLLGAKKL